nr:phosphoadenosine phosphosulfate reductase family protein [uncultured Desulfobacter sp.]
MNKPIGKRAYWCDACHVPLLGPKCLACGAQGRDLCAATLVPVFRPEIQYLKKIVPKEVHPLLKEGEVWVALGQYAYYCQGILIFKLAAKTEQVTMAPEAEQLRPLTRTKKQWLTNLQQANRRYIEDLQYEAEGFIRNTVTEHGDKTTLISFSGGKDSTVASHLVMNGLGRSDVLHIFADTTIEFPDTYQYIKDFQQHHPLTPFIKSKSKLDFFQTAETIGPPSRILRWCCTTHKTNPLAKLIDSMSPEYGVLTFDGVRRSESTRRSKYPRISNKHKIARETLASPILHWTDVEVWLYLLFHELPFNQAYKKGFRRVGCLYCPFNSAWSQKMIAARYPQKDKKWKTFLHKQAQRMQHPNPEIFADQGWRARAGGRGLDHYKSALEFQPCKLSADAVMYQLLSGDIRLLRHFLRPFGPQSMVSSDDFSEIFLIHDQKTHEILASVEVGYVDEAIRINYLIKKYRRLFQQRVEKQLKKLQTCIFCGACGAKCKMKALNSEGGFKIDETKCISCLSCVKHVCPVLDSLTKRGK